MIDQTRTTTGVLPLGRRWLALGALVGAGALLVLVGLSVAPFLFAGASLESEIAEQVRSTTGLMLKVDGAVHFSLLPEPHVAMETLHLADPSGTLAIDADALEGDVRLLPLLVGRLEIATATLDRPRLAIDLDGKPMPADSTIGRALRAGRGLPANGNARLGIVTLVDGTAILKSRTPGTKAASEPARRETPITAINVTIDWRNLDAPATLTGTVAFQNVAADVAAWVAQPSSLLRGDHSAIALRVQSAPLDLSANGEFASAPRPQFRGRVAVTAPSLGAALALAGFDAALPAPFAALSLTSDATLNGGALDLPNLRLHLDGNDYEGTLAYQHGDAKASLAGTLATEQLSLAPFLSRAPALLDANRHWSRQPLAVDLRDPIDLDLRISATHLHLPALAVDDAALAVMTRDNRTEIALVEGKAYGGSLKGRASIGRAAQGMSVRASGVLTNADAGALSWDVFGRQLATGALSASANLETAGASPDALMRNLHGWAKGGASEGELSDVDLGHGLREAARMRFDAIVPALRNGHTPFQTLTFALRIVDGIVVVDDGLLKGQDAILTVGGKADVGTRALALHAAAMAPPVPSGPASTPTLRFGIEGTFDQAVVMPDLGGLHAVAPAGP